MPRLTGLADHSKLWVGPAAVLTLTGSPRARRAAGRGITTLAATGLIANQVAKRLNRRPRPLLLRVPLARIAGRIPTSTSFPSGHAASAAAFASAVALEIPALRVPLATLAGLVGFSRVATGAHYPSDVAAGFVLGATEVNPASHSGKGHDVLTRVQRDLPDISVIGLTADDDVAQVMQRAAAGAEVLGVAGRDGTVGAAAEAALAAGIPLAVFPAGTFNHFAKALVHRAIRAVREGTATKMDVAYANDKLLLNTASVGAYSDLVARRQRLGASLSNRGEGGALGCLTWSGPFTAG